MTDVFIETKFCDALVEHGVQAKPCAQALTRVELRTRDGAVEQVIYFCTGHGTRKRLHGPETIDAQPEASAAETPQLT